MQVGKTYSVEYLVANLFNLRLEEGLEQLLNEFTITKKVNSGLKFISINEPSPEDDRFQKVKESEVEEKSGDLTIGNNPEVDTVEEADLNYNLFSQHLIEKYGQRNPSITELIQYLRGYGSLLKGISAKDALSLFIKHGLLTPFKQTERGQYFSINSNYNPKSQ